MTECLVYILTTHALKDGLSWHDGRTDSREDY